MGEFVAVLGVLFVIGVPVLALATRFALRPLIRDLIEARGPRAQDRETIERLVHRVAQLEHEAIERDRRVDELADAELFRRQLEAPPQGGRPQDST